MAMIILSFVMLTLSFCKDFDLRELRLRDLHQVPFDRTQDTYGGSQRVIRDGDARGR